MRKHIARIIKSTYGPSLVFLAAFALVAVLTIATHSPKRGAPTLQEAAVTSLHDYDGNSVNFQSFVGHPVVVFFWATWCPYCESELQNLAQVKAKEGNNITVLAVNRGEPLSVAKSYTDALNLTGITYLLDSNDALFKKLGGYAMPEMVFIDRIGNIVVHQRGPIDPAQVDQAVAQMLK